MRTILLFIFLFISNLAFSQEMFLGKTTDEIKYSIPPSKSYIMTINNYQAICQIVDTNITDIYCFNHQGICIEYKRLFSNITPDILKQFLSDYFDTGDIWIDNSKGLIAMVKQKSSTLIEVSIRKKEY